MNDGVLAAWALILQRTVGSHLLMHCDRGSIREKTAGILQIRGIDPDRIEFVPYQEYREYLASYRRIDIVLDTFACAGGTTTFDAIRMGVPVMSLAGKTAIGRGGVSILTNLGLTELVARSVDEYVSIAANLASDRSRRVSFWKELPGMLQRSPLTDASRFARNLETAFRSMWTAWCIS